MSTAVSCGLTSASLVWAGQSAAMISAVVSKWFLAKRGAALGYATLGGGVAAFVLPPVLGPVVDHFGWRAAWVLLA